MEIFEDLNSVPCIALDYRFAGLVRLCGLGIPAKWIETRGHRTRYRGPVGIYATHGSATKNDAFLAHWFDETRKRLVPEFVSKDLFDANTSRTMCGKVIALATIDRMSIHADHWVTRGACVGRNDNEKRSNHVAWRLNNIWPLDPFNAVPAPGFFRVPASQVERAICTWFYTQHIERDPQCSLNQREGIALAGTYLREEDWPGLGARWSYP